MIKIFVCDDDAVFAGLLAEQIRDAFGALGAECDVRTFSSSVECVRAVRLEKEGPDAAFLDIDMPSVSGFGLAAEIREAKRGVFIVFVSGKQELVFESFDYHPFSFVRKSSGENLRASISKVCSSIVSAMKQSKLVEILDVYSGPVCVTAEDILYVSSQDHYQVYVLGNGKKPVKERGTIRDVEAKLSPLGFIRPHSRYVVNAAHVSFFSPKINRIVLDSKDSIPVSRSMGGRAHEEYLKYKREF